MRTGDVKELKIKNLRDLSAQGDVEARCSTLGIAERALERLDVSAIIDSMVRWDGAILTIGELCRDLRPKRRVVVVGAGKAVNAMAAVLDAKLGARIDSGLVIAKAVDEEDRALRHIEVTAGGHPLPDDSGLRAAKRILALVDEATEDDLFIGLISGGSSALMACPVEGVTLEDEIKLTEELLKSGARILEVNAVRRHISATNGGRLAQKIEAKGAEMTNLVIADVVGIATKADLQHPATCLGTPVGVDGTTVEDALEVLERYQLRGRVPLSILEHLETSARSDETPKEFGDGIRSFILQVPADASQAAVDVAEELGLAAHVLTTMLEGESREAGGFLACLAREIGASHRPVRPPCVLIAGGETTTSIQGRCGLGGPSQELALGFALEIADGGRCCIAAIDTDGTDGPTAVAGGVCDSTTLERARQKGIDVFTSLRLHDSYHVLRRLGDEVVTGNTGTNLCDLNIVTVLAR